MPGDDEGKNGARYFQRSKRIDTFQPERRAGPQGSSHLFCDTIAAYGGWLVRTEINHAGSAALTEPKSNKWSIRSGQVMTLFLLIALLGQIAPATDADLTEAEQAFEHAARNRLTETLARLLHQDYIWIDADGAQQTSARFLRHVKESADIDIDSNVRTRSYGATAIAFGETRDGPYAQRFTRIWVRTSAGWRLFAYQKTSITPSPSSSQPQERRPDSPSRDETNFIVNTTARTRAEREVVDAVRAINRAEHAPDWSAWAALTVDEFQVVNVRGHVDLKADRVNTIRQQLQSTAFPIVRDLRVRVFGNAAVMTAIQEPASARPFRFTRLWVKTESGWRQVINQQTAIQSSTR